LFQQKESVKACGPTGLAAFNVGGVTCHHAFSLPRVPELGEISQNKLKLLGTSKLGLDCCIDY
jgi:hypothetical protein